MAKTLRQIADELGVSKQAVSKRLSQLSPTDVSVGANRKKLVSPRGEALLRKLMSSRLPEVDTNQPPTLISLVATFQEQLKAKDEQIAALNRQLEAKDGQIAFLQENTTHAQQLHAGTIQHQLTDGRIDPAPTPGKPPGIFSRLFGRRTSR